MFGTLMWKIFSFSMIKVNPYGFGAMLIGMGLFYIVTWKATAPEARGFWDNAALWLLIGVFVFLFPECLIALRVSYFFNSIPMHSVAFLGVGIGLIFCVSLIHKLVGLFFTNGLWLLDVIHITALYWMPKIAPLKISIGRDLVLPELFKWTSAYIYYGIVLLFIVGGLLVHAHRGNPRPLVLGNRVYSCGKISLKIALTILMGLFGFVCCVLMMKYVDQIKELMSVAEIGGVTVVGGFENRIRMTQYLFLLYAMGVFVTGIMMIWMWFANEIATAHTQVILIFLPLIGLAVIGQVCLFLGEKIGTLMLLVRPELSQFLPSFQDGWHLLYALYGVILFLGYILCRGLLFPKKIERQNTSSVSTESNSTF